MINLYARMVKWPLINRVHQFVGNRVLKQSDFPFIGSQCCGMQRCTVNNFTTRNVVRASMSSSQPTIDRSIVKEEIYAGPLSRRIHSLKFMTLATSLGTLFLLKDIHNRIEFPNQAVMVIGVGVIVLFSLLTPCLINLISKKYCVKMYYDHSTKQYSALIYTFLFKKKLIVFTPKDVVVPQVNKFFTVAYIKNHPMFFDVDHFKTVDYYKNIMGYDKPVDFTLNKKD